MFGRTQPRGRLSPDGPRRFRVEELCRRLMLSDTPTELPPEPPPEPPGDVEPLPNP